MFLSAQDPMLIEAILNGMILFLGIVGGVLASWLYATR